MAGVRKGRERGLGRETTREGGGERRFPPSFLARSSRFSRAENSLSLSFQLPATQATSASASDSDNLVFTRSLAERKRRSRKQSQKKWKRSDSSDSDSVALMTPLTTPIFDFH